jgi:carboxylesterase type B
LVQHHRVALLLGSNARERIPGTPPPTDLKKAIEETFGPIAGRAQLLYVGGADPLYGTPADQWATDTSFRCSEVAQLVWHAAAGNPAFEYEFARVPAGREAAGATHASELSFVFGTLEEGIFAGRAGRPPILRTAVDTQVSDVMQQYWTNFAKTGNQWRPIAGLAKVRCRFTGIHPIYGCGSDSQTRIAASIL